MENDANFLNQLLLHYGWYVIAVQLILLVIVIVFGYTLIRRKLRMLQQSRPATIKLKESGSLLDIVEEARKSNPKQTLNVVLGSGDFSVEEEMTIDSPTRFLGSGTQDTRIVAKGKHPAIKIKDSKDCVISNVRVEGGIHCSNGELLVENCHIVAQDDGICIEAYDGSTVTFSGMIRGEGGIAVRALGESKVVLKPPYAVSGEDYVVLDPKSSISVHNKESEDSEKNNS